ncbi:hypothetical protein JUN65_08295 [Gluconacetobacter azotocaptans]|uniref:hypothetical protein n=1 Tax=Gluconacetobacter azotocaptans TaxID=142834 RepID=UPI00195A86E2|nr:hypothetical protein [Gluconacetobacter azotocaptans]MBM9401585.1 hypothetical protein [Gluconacetobacter azotocaptans]
MSASLKPGFRIVYGKPAHGAEADRWVRIYRCGHTPAMLETLRAGGDRRVQHLVIGDRQFLAISTALEAQ